MEVGEDDVRIQGYIRVVGTESEIRAIHDGVQVCKATVMQLKMKLERPGGEHLWCWKTDLFTFKTQDVDEGMKEVLHQYQPLGSVIKKQQGVQVSFQLVTLYSKGESPQGLYVSAETISLLSSLGAALDNDAVRDITRTKGDGVKRTA